MGSCFDIKFWVQGVWLEGEFWGGTVCDTVFTVFTVQFLKKPDWGVSGGLSLRSKKG